MIRPVEYLLRGDTEFYGGKTYIHQGAYFPVYASKDGAKRYKSRKIAENAAARLEEKCGEKFTVEENKD